MPEKMVLGSEWSVKGRSFQIEGLTTEKERTFLSDGGASHRNTEKALFS